MSRYGEDDTYPEDQADPTNSECPDCGGAFWRAEMDRCVFCGPCAQQRDAWATAQELKTMAKAILNADLTKVRDIA